MQLIWVRGHSGNKGNDRADLLAQWGKASGPHSRIPLRGETKERAKSRAELRKKIEELQKAEQKAKPSSTNQNNQNNQNNNMITNDNDEDSPNEDDSDDGHVAMWPCLASRARRPFPPPDQRRSHQRRARSLGCLFESLGVTQFFGVQRQPHFSQLG